MIQLSARMFSNHWPYHSPLVTHSVEPCIAGWRSHNSWMDFSTHCCCTPLCVIIQGVHVCPRVCLLTCAINYSVCVCVGCLPDALSSLEACQYYWFGVGLHLQQSAPFLFYFFFPSTSSSLQRWQRLISWFKSALIGYCHFWIKVSTLTCPDLY